MDILGQLFSYFANANLSLGREFRYHFEKIGCRGSYPGDASADKTAPRSSSLDLITQPPASQFSRRGRRQASALEIKQAGLSSEYRKKTLPSFIIAGGPGSRSKIQQPARSKFWGMGSEWRNFTNPFSKVDACVPKFANPKLFNGRRSRISSTLFGRRGSRKRAFRRTVMQRNEEHLKKPLLPPKRTADLTWDRYGGSRVYSTLWAQRRSFEAESRLLALKKERLHNRIDLYLALG